MIIALRTDNPDAEIYLYQGKDRISSFTWHADRQLARDLLTMIHTELQKQGADWHDITGVLVFEGPGSFTGLRIGITVADTLAYGLKVPIVAAKGDNWLKEGISRLEDGENDKLALPHYGAEANITMPKK